MAFTIPDSGEGDNDIQSILYQEQLDVLVAGIQGIDCVLSGLAVTGGADMTPAVAKGAVLSNRVMFAVAAADVTITTADATNPRLDLIVVTSAGALAVRAGTAATAPKPPARTANDVVIAIVYVPANDTAIATTQITDMRVFPPYPICIYRLTAADTTNNTTSAMHLLNKSGSGLSIPDGLFLSGRILRVRLGGNILQNSGTPTQQVIVSYGGSTMFDDTSGVGAADTDRTAWALDLDLVAQGNSDQSLNGICTMGIIATKTAATTGIGDAWSTAANTGPISGASAVNSDAGNRTLLITLTFSGTASASNEVVIEYATVELL